jgi:hypothetical protein
MKTINRIVVWVEGGQVQGITSDYPLPENVEVHVADDENWKAGDDYIKEYGYGINKAVNDGGFAIGPYVHKGKRINVVTTITEE